MSPFLETTVGKFTFRVDPTCHYNEDGVWVRVAGSRARLGLADFVQQHSGDVAFVEVRLAGTPLSFGEEFASIETIKVDLTLAAPVTGVVALVNPALAAAPEIINLDPYGDGWLCEVEISGWDADRSRLLDAAAYFAKMKDAAQEEAR